MFTYISLYTTPPSRIPSKKSQKNKKPLSNQSNSFKKKKSSSSQKSNRIPVFSWTCKSHSQ